MIDKTIDVASWFFARLLAVFLIVPAAAVFGLFALSPVRPLDQTHVPITVMNLAATGVLLSLVIIAFAPLIIWLVSSRAADAVWRAYGVTAGKLVRVTPSPIRRATVLTWQVLKPLPGGLANGIDKLLAGGAVVAIWVGGGLLLAGLVYLLFQAAAALPISIAVIIGAVIIAAAVRR